MITVSLHRLHFFAFHGLYEEEQKVAGEFAVDIDIFYEPGEAVTEIDNTVNYAAVYELVKERMGRREDLLETVAMDMTEKIREQWNFIKEIMVRIEKKNPPIHNFRGSVSVTYRKQF